MKDWKELKIPVDSKFNENPQPGQMSVLHFYDNQVSPVHWIGFRSLS